jgi:hypothetical protein
MVIAQQMAEIPSKYTSRRSLQLFDSERIERSRIYVCGIERTQCEESAKMTDVNDGIDRSPESPNAFDAPQTVWTTAATLRPRITGRSSN